MTARELEAWLAALPEADRDLEVRTFDTDGGWYEMDRPEVLRTFDTPENHRDRSDISIRIVALS